MSSLPSRSGGYWQAAPHRLTDSLTSILEHILQRFGKSPDNPFDHFFEWRVTVEQKTVKGDELADRLARYAGGVLRIVAELPETKEGRLLRDQLSRSGTAPGAHYAEARGGQSRSDFIHKVALALDGNLAAARVDLNRLDRGDAVSNTPGPRTRNGRP